MKTPSRTNSTNRSPLRRAFLLIPLVLACFGLLSTASAAPPANVSLGPQALQSNTTGTNDTALGYQAMKTNTTGTDNTAVGFKALNANTTDGFNTAIGSQALFNNTDNGGHNNVATGYQALFSNETGRRNVANGSTALFSNTTGNFNVAQGDQALYSNTTGILNTAIGFAALYSNLNCDDPGCNVGGGANTAVGAETLESLTTGGGNIAIGEAALINHTTGNQNIAVGLRAGQNLTNGGVNVYIANQGVPAENHTIRIGNVVFWRDIYGFGHPVHTDTYIAGIDGQATSDAATTVPVVIDVNGKLGTAASSKRFKRDIAPMEKTSEALLALKPVTFHYKNDNKNTPQFGLVAEDVAKVNPDLVARDANGEIYTVRYEAVNAMLLNEFLKEHRKVEQLKNDFQATVAQQQKEIQALTAQLKEQAAQVQKVSAQLEVSKPAPQTVLNNQ